MIGHFVKIDSPDGEYYSLVKVLAQLTDELFLVQCLHPATMEPNRLGQYVLDLNAIALGPGDGDPRGRIFETQIALREFLDWVDDDPLPAEPHPEGAVH